MPHRNNPYLPNIFTKSIPNNNLVLLLHNFISSKYSVMLPKKLAKFFSVLKFCPLEDKLV